MKLISKFIAFCSVGIGATLIDWMVFNVFYSFTRAFVLSMVIALVCSMTFNFSVNRNFTFGARGFPVGKQLVKWLLIYGISFLSRIAIGKIILITLGESILNANIAYFAGIAIEIPINFFGSLLWAFRRR